MSYHLAKALREQNKIRSLPIKRGDEDKILKEKQKENQEKLFSSL